MTAEPVPIIPTDDGNFTSDETVTVILGECLCPGRPHAEDWAEVLTELPWDVLVEVGMLSGSAAYKRLVQGALVSWNLVDALGEDVPVTAVGRLRQERVEPIAEAVNAAYERTKAPLPNGSGAPSRRSRRESASSLQTTRLHGKPTKSR